ncbi:anti-sigma-I factor RsgI family protein [Clostridium sp. 'White wine YQ']|uniref:anti-sigma-I factor RsgI family protein n=1 Tax=Clostridium sp. 'White wine YQ' TaxID=3027474 RepID=UPI0023670E3C|nr:hypothetical protein [Clostridium sp. 'White wine YQ']MDD7795273.1 hypothetical protein [Clostridium sp. 'White wine YQ']
MKGIVLEKHDGYGIILDAKGKFHKVKNIDNLVIGQEYISNSVFKFNRSLVYKVASLAMVMLFVSFGYAYAKPSSYISLDINPSVELKSNMFGRIVDVNPLNEDGKKIYSGLKLKGEKEEEALGELIKAAKDNGYLKVGEDNAVAITLSSNSRNREDKVKELEVELKQELNDADLGKTEVVVQNLNLERHQEAESLGISPGKMLLIEKLQSEEQGVSAEEYANKPVKEIMKAINEAKKDDKAEVKKGKTDSGEVNSDKNNATQKENKDKAQSKDEKTQNSNIDTKSGKDDNSSQGETKKAPSEGKEGANNKDKK